MRGILIVNKETDYTSHDVVAKLRGILHQKKIGHTGTLDPQATGCLPVCLGSATRVCDILTEKDKTYTCSLRFGITTDTQDIFGTILEEKKSSVTEEDLLTSCKAFTGEIEQLTPMYSARKVNGQKLCDLARKGIEVARNVKRITIYSIVLTAFDFANQEAEIVVSCSSGTYIRTLCHDLGQMLGCGACMTKLHRNSVGLFHEEMAHTLKEIEEARDNHSLGDYLIPIESLFQDYLPAKISEGYEHYLINGNQLREEWFQCERKHPEKLAMYKDGVFYALYQRKNDWYVNYKMFPPEESEVEG